MREARMLGAEHLKEKLESRLYKQNFGRAFFFDKIPFFFQIVFMHPILPILCAK